MENSTDYLEVLNNIEMLYNKHSDIILSSSILIIFGGVIGVIGNATIIFFYFFRIKDLGERYFIPWLAVVDLLGCIILPINRIITTKYMYNFPSSIVCRVLSFLKVSIPGISAHMLLLISIQRYLLVCRPFVPQWTRFWKRIYFGIVCLVAFVYSSPFLIRVVVLKETVTFMNKTVTMEMCTYFEVVSSSVRAYASILALIVVFNIVLTAGFYIPVLKRISLRFSRKIFKIHEENCFDSNKGSLDEAEGTDCFENDNSHINGMRNHCKMEIIQMKENISNSSMKTCKEFNRHEEGIGTISADYPIPTKKKTTKTKTTSSQRSRRMTIMFLVLIVAYVLSYIPPLILSILLMDEFKISTMTKLETAVFYYMGGLLILNHIINPLIYGCFDKKFRKKMRRCCLRKK